MSTNTCGVITCVLLLLSGIFAVITLRRSSTVNPRVEPAPTVTSLDERDRVTGLEGLDDRVTELRVREIEGALFEALALGLLKRPSLDVEAVLRASRESAMVVGFGYNPYNRDVMQRGAANFERKVREARSVVP